VIVDPPLDGANHDTTAAWFCAVALTLLGAPGIPATATAFEVPESPGPNPFVALTMNVYVSPTARLENEHEVVDCVVQVVPFVELDGDVASSTVTW